VQPLRFLYGLLYRIFIPNPYVLSFEGSFMLWLKKEEDCFFSALLCLENMLKCVVQTEQTVVK